MEDNTRYRLERFLVDVHYYLDQKGVLNEMEEALISEAEGLIDILDVDVAEFGYW